MGFFYEKTLLLINMDYKFNKNDKVVRRYYGDKGWTYVFRTEDGIEYHISRTDIINNIYKDKNTSNNE